MSTQTEQQKARQAYTAGRPQRDPRSVQTARDNARITGGNAAASGGAR